MIVSVVAGAVRGHLADGLAQSGAGALRGALTGATVCLAVLAIELFVFENDRANRLRKLPFSVAIMLRALVYIAIIVIALSIVPALISGAPIALPRPRDVWLAIALSMLFNALVGINQLLGQGVLFSFIAGRYHRPQIEERIVLFLDMASSTRHAEHLGELRFLDFLNRFIADVTTPIVRAGGEIHKYVGDEVIATWPPGNATANIRCVTACFDALRTLEEAAATYSAEFGVVPQFRAGLHIGPVVVGELGLFRLEIALLGDTMNTAARIQTACRETKHSVLVSRDLMERMGPLSSSVSTLPLGRLQLRGKQAELEVVALAHAKS
jgi:adenylate cyclase